jgi:transposase
VKADYNQQYLLPPSLEDLLDSGHPARFLREFVDSLDSSRFELFETKGSHGRPHYSWDLLMKVWLYGYFHKVRTTRDLERWCHNDIGMMWLTGMNYPDHNTLWRFFNRNKKAIRAIFKEATEAVLDLGMISFALHALDGTKIQAQVSTRTGWNEGKLAKAMMDLDSSIDEVISEIESFPSNEDDGYLMPEELRNKANLTMKLEEHRKRRAELDDVHKEMEAINRRHLHEKDKDARMMKCWKVKDYAYNAQGVVDEGSGLIVAQDVVNDENDNNMLTPMIEQVEENLGERARETVADGGYYSPEQLIKAEEAGMDVIINISKQIEPACDGNDYHKSRFKYDAEKDVFICPQGKELRFERIKNNRQKKNKLRVYRCHHWKDCPKNSSCSSEKRGKSIEMGPQYAALQRQIQKQKDPYKKELLAKRKGIVEPVFGIIKHCMGFRRFTVRGLEKVKTQWSLICTTLNLRKLFKLWCAGKLVFA